MTSYRAAFLTLSLAVIALLLLVASGIGYQRDAWALPTAFAMIKWAAYTGIATALLAVAGALIARPVGGRLCVFEGTARAAARRLEVSLAALEDGPGPQQVRRVFRWPIFR